MNDQQFINRKRDHIEVALKPDSQTRELSLWSLVQLQHVSMPELNFSEVDFSCAGITRTLATPFFISGMTAGHADAEKINFTLAEACAKRGWQFGLGSQRRELRSDFKDHAVYQIKERFPSLELISNLGMAQLIELSERDQLNQLEEILLSSRADAIAIHLNPLQEAIQVEGTPHFKGSRCALEHLLKTIRIPVILKETGSGMSRIFLESIKDLPLYAIDVSGLGGTHWGRVEGIRAELGTETALVGETFKDWGVSTLESLLNASAVLSHTQIKIWASGGIRSGLDAAKSITLGSHRVGFAMPALRAALAGPEALHAWMQQIERELKIAMFCTNSGTLAKLDKTKVQFLNKGQSSL